MKRRGEARRSVVGAGGRTCQSDDGGAAAAVGAGGGGAAAAEGEGWRRRILRRGQRGRRQGCGQRFCFEKVEKSEGIL